MRLSFNLLDSDSDIKREILNSLRIEIDSLFKKVLPSIKDKIRYEVKAALVSEPEYQSLISGQLKYEFGIPTSQQVNNIIDIWINNISVDYSGVKTNNMGLAASLSLNMIESSYNDVLASEGAIVIDNLSGAALPWLEWLLLFGGKIIVRNYRVKLGPNSRSRTGNAIMIESSGNNWRVPPEFAGTSSNNWVTRALSKVDSKIIDILEKSLESAI